MPLVFKIAMNARKMSQSEPKLLIFLVIQFVELGYHNVFGSPEEQITEKAKVIRKYFD